MNRHAELGDFFTAGCALLPLPLLVNFGPIVSIGVLLPLLAAGCYCGAMEQVETGEGPLLGNGLEGDAVPPDAGEPARPR